jgi:hypothetical protein
MLTVSNNAVKCMVLVDNLTNNSKTKELTNANMKITGKEMYLRMPLPEAIKNFYKSEFIWVADRVERGFAFKVDASKFSDAMKADLLAECAVIWDSLRTPPRFIDSKGNGRGLDYFIGTETKRDGSVSIYVPYYDSNHSIIFDANAIDAVLQALKVEKTTSCMIRMDGSGNYSFASHTETDGSIGNHFVNSGPSAQEKEESFRRQTAKIDANKSRIAGQPSQA